MLDLGRIVFLAGCLTCALRGTAAFAKDPEPQSAPAAAASTAKLTPEVVKARLKKTQDTSGLEESEIKERKILIEQYQTALEHLETAGQNAAKAAKFRKEADEAPKQLQRLKADKKTPALPIPELSPNMGLNELQEAFFKADQAFDDLQEKLIELQNEPNRRAERRDEIRTKREAAQEELQEIEKQQEGMKDEPESADDIATLANWTLLAARRLDLETEIEEFAEEIHNYQITQDLLIEQTDRLTEQVAEAEKQIKDLRAAVSTRRRQEAQQDVAQARKAAADAHPAVQRVAELNSALAAQRETLIERMDLAGKQLETLDGQVSEIKELFGKVTERVKRVGHTEAVGLLLRKKRELLPRVAEHQFAIDERKAEIARISLQLVELEDQRAAIVHLDEQVQLIVVEARNSKSSQKLPTENQVRAVLQTNRDYLRDLIRDTNLYLDTLTDLDSKESELIATTREFSAYLNEYFLWIRNAELPSASDIRNLQGGLSWILSPRGWSAVAQEFASDVSRHPVGYATIPALIFLLVVTPHFFRKRLQAAGHDASLSSTTTIRPTVVSLVATIFLSVVWPGAIWLASWRLAHAALMSDFLLSLSRGLDGVAILLVMLNVVRHLCRDQGLGETHFGWPQARLTQIRKSTWWLTAIGLPLACVVIMTESQRDETIKNSLGRAAFIALQVLLLVSAHRAWNSPVGLMRDLAASQANRWWQRLGRFARAISIGAPMVLAALATIGHYYTAVQLAERLLATVWLMGGLLVLHAVLLRCLRIAFCDLATTRDPELTAQVDATGRSIANSPAVNSAAEPRIGLSDIEQQAHRLLNLAGLCVFLVVSSRIWVEVFPAVEFLDRVMLWPKPFTLIAAGATDAPLHYVLTVGHLAMAILFGLLTLAASRNVPGFVEIVVLRKFKLDSGARYAVDALTRYTIMVIGFCMAFGQIGMGWENMSFLVGALTFGLGFGLKMIFSNFASGLLLLFERPVRIGDMITVGAFTGTVTRIRIRATTILDEERREIIIPNTDLFEGKIMNWTLSDTISRMMIQVDVAYGNDTDLVKKVLLKVAADNPMVLKDPAPQALFDEFGDSTLVFKLSVYLGDRKSYSQLRHELNTAIKAAFRQGHIEMSVSLPDMEIHDAETRVPEPYSSRVPSRV